MKNKWIFMSLATCLILLAGVLLIDLYRGVRARNQTNADEATSLREEIEAAPVLRENAEKTNEATVEEDTKEIVTEEALDVIQKGGAKIGSNSESTKFVSASCKITVFGDVLLHENVLNNANRNAGGNGTKEDYSAGFDFAPMFEDVKDLVEDADLALINQASLTGANDAPQALSGYPKFNGPSFIAESYSALGFDGVNIANNHALDLGADGWQNAVNTWKSKPIKAFGAYADQNEKKDPDNKILNVNGIRIAVLSYVTDTNFHLNREQDLGIPFAAVNGTALLKKEIKGDIDACREKADLILVWIYWSGDASFETTDFERECALFLAEAGADVIIGTGPKVLQKTEWIASSDGRKALCCYSLGNSLCTMQFIENLLGGVLQFNVEKNESGQVSVKNVVVVPTVISYDESVDHLKVLKLSSFDEAAFDRHGSNLLYGKGEYAWLARTVQKQIDASFLPAVFR